VACLTAQRRIRIFALLFGTKSLDAGEYDTSLDERQSENGMSAIGRTAGGTQRCFLLRQANGVASAAVSLLPRGSSHGAIFASSQEFSVQWLQWT